MCFVQFWTMACSSSPKMSYEEGLKCMNHTMAYRQIIHVKFNHVQEDNDHDDDEGELNSFVA